MNSIFHLRRSVCLFASSALLLGCASPGSKFTADLASIDKQQEAERDASAGKESRAVRLAYIDAHPELTGEERAALREGALSIHDIENARAQLEMQKNQDEKSRIASAAGDQARLQYSKRTDVPLQIRNAVAARQIVNGMTTDQVKLSWGNPTSVTQTTGATGTFETWTYRNRNSVLFFSNGLLEHFVQPRKE